MSTSILTYLTQAAIRDSVQQMTGEIVTRPALLKTDGSSLTYCADVQIPVAATIERDPVTGTIETGRILRNVPIAMGNRDLIYANINQAVTLTRNGSSGRFEITGFAKSKPGKYVRIAVDLGEVWGGADGSGAGGTGPVVGLPVDAGITVRRLTLGDYADPTYSPGGSFVPWGVIPLGSYASFNGDTYLGLNGILG